MTNTYTNPLDGLSVDDKTILASLAPQALALEAKHLALKASMLQRDAFGADNADAIAKTKHELDAGNREFLKEAERHPHLTKPLTEIGVLAKQAYDPRALDMLNKVRDELAPLAKGERADEAPQAAQKRATADRPSVPHLPNEVEGGGPAALLSSRYDPKAVPEEVASRYTVRGKEFIHPRDPTRVAFVDHGARLQTNKSFDGQAVKAMVAIAESRGWDSIKVTGDEAFRRAIWIEAASRGIAVNGYKPTEAEKKAVVSISERNGRLNRIEENPAATAFLAAKDQNERYSAAKLHPELKSAFVMQAALKRFAEQTLRPSDRQKFMDRQQQNIARDVSQGIEIPSPLIRDKRNQRDRDREAQSER